MSTIFQTWISLSLDRSRQTPIGHFAGKQELYSDEWMPRSEHLDHHHCSYASNQAASIRTNIAQRFDGTVLITRKSGANGT